MTTTSKITSKAQTTVPRDVRNALGLEAGDVLEWEREGAGFRVRKSRSRARLRKWVGSVESLRGKDVDELVDEMRGR